MGRKRPGNEAYVEDWCLQNECQPEDLDVEVIEVQTLCTLIVSQYKKQYYANFTPRYDEWHWRKVVTKIRDFGVDADKFITCQVKRRKGRFSASNLLESVALSDYEDYLENYLREAVVLLVEKVKYILYTSKTIPVEELFNRVSNEYSPLLMYGVYSLIATLSTKYPDKVLKYTLLANDLVVKARAQWENKEEKQIHTKLWEEFNGTGIPVKEILINTLS